MENVERSLAELEEHLQNLEKCLFDEGPFSAKKVKESLDLRKFQMQLGRISESDILQKKVYYQDSLTELCDTLTPIKNLSDGVTLYGNHGSRFASILERCEKCENEVTKIREVIEEYDI